MSISCCSHKQADHLRTCDVQAEELAGAEGSTLDKSTAADGSELDTSVPAGGASTEVVPATAKVSIMLKDAAARKLTQRHMPDCCANDSCCGP